MQVLRASGKTQLVGHLVDALQLAAAGGARPEITVKYGPDCTYEVRD